MPPILRRRFARFSVGVVFLGLVALFGRPEPKNDFRFSIVGDRTGGPQPEVYGRVWREIALLNPDFAINVGDTIQGGKDELAAAQWAELRPLWKRYGIQQYFTPGNHDIWNDYSRGLYRQETGRATYYGFNYQDAHFTVLDNSRTTDLTAEQIAFLEKDLKANADRRPKFVFFHKPYWIALLKLRSSDFPLHKLALKYGVEYVISGHGHQFVRMQRDGVTYMEVGSSGGNLGGLRRGEGFDKGWFYHHVWARVKRGKVEFTVKEIDGPKGKGRMFKAEDWDENGSKFPIDDPASAEKPQT